MRRGWDDVSEMLRWLAARWSDSTTSSFDLVAVDVSGDLAYIVGFEHIANSVGGVPVEPYTRSIRPSLGCHHRSNAGSVGIAPVIDRHPRAHPLSAPPGVPRA